LIAALKTHSNVDIELNTKMTQIIREEPLTGRVLGIAAQTATGTVYFRANRAVIVGTGGWKGNPWLRSLFDPRIGPNITYSGTPFCYDDGTGLLAAINAGAALEADRNMDIHAWHRQWGTLYHSFPLGSAYTVPGLNPSSAADYIFVNSLGNRYMDENTPETSGWFFGDPPYSFYDYTIDQNTTGPYGTLGCWTIMDSAAMSREIINPATWLGPPATVDPNLVASGSTLSALETAINVPPGSLTATINKYNSYVAASPPADPDFGKPATLLIHQINTPPYYAIWTNVVLHDTCGGVPVNGDAQVLDINGNTIPNLYAAGEAAAGLDTIGMAKGVVMGRVAGENASFAQSW
jgi:fumarate reductase flavoprotein subunit